MIEKEITRKVYVSKDGKKFLEAEQCKKYEETLSNIEYFCVRCQPDLSETGYYMHKIYVAVFSPHYFHKEIVMEWALRKFKRILGPGVMGCGYQPHFSISKCIENEYFEMPPTIWGGVPLDSEKIFLSSEEVEGFPEPYDYVKEWGLNN